MLSIALLFLLGAPPAPQTWRYEVEGKVAWETVQAPTQPFRVRLESFGGPIVGEVFTDGAGNFTFTDVPAGTYYVRASADGVQDAAERVEVPSPVRLLILMNPKPSRPAAGPLLFMADRISLTFANWLFPRKRFANTRKPLKIRKRGV